VTSDGDTHIAHRVEVDIRLTAPPDTVDEMRIRDWCADELLEELAVSYTHLTLPTILRV